MANRSFDFGKIQRSFYTTKLKDGTTLVVNMPKKRTFEKMTELQEMDENEVTNEIAFQSIAGLMAEILSNNKNGQQITADYVADQYDIEEMLGYIKDYMIFVDSLKANPN